MIFYVNDMFFKNFNDINDMSSNALQGPYFSTSLINIITISRGS